MTENNTTLDARTAKILKDCGLGNDALWLLERKLQGGGVRRLWIMYHWACERAAAHKGVTWEPPQVIHADPERKLAVILVTGKMGGNVEWSFGEAAPYNTKQAYPFAMAEKRGKDRVILKLIGLHGLVYSEEEADDFKPSKDTMSGPLKKLELKGKMREFAADLTAVSDEAELIGLLNSYQGVLDQCQRDLPSWWYGNEGDVAGAMERIEERRVDFKQAETIYAGQAAE